MNGNERPIGARSARENVSWILDHARYARDTKQPDNEWLLEQIVTRAQAAYESLDVADKALNEWTAMTGPPAGI